jgi:hypothetical protein
LFISASVWFSIIISWEKEKVNGFANNYNTTCEANCVTPLKKLRNKQQKSTGKLNVSNTFFLFIFYLVLPEITVGGRGANFNLPNTGKYRLSLNWSKKRNLLFFSFSLTSPLF